MLGAWRRRNSTEMVTGGDGGGGEFDSKIKQIFWVRNLSLFTIFHFNSYIRKMEIVFNTYMLILIILSKFIVALKGKLTKICSHFCMVVQ